MMVPETVFLFTVLTSTFVLCPACSAPCAGETVRVGGGCACQVRGNALTFLRVRVAVAPWRVHVSANFGVSVRVARGVGESVATSVADAAAVPESANAVSTAEEESDGV